MSNSSGPSLVGGLTPRELDVLTAASEGLSVAETGGRLFVEPATVKFHRTSILQKLGAANIAHAVALGYEREIFNLRDRRRSRITVWTHCGFTHSFPHCPICGVHVDRVTHSAAVCEGGET